MKRKFKFDLTLLEIIYILSIVLCLVLNWRGAFVGPEIAIRALETQGYADVKIITRHESFAGCRGCSGHDAARFDVVAKNAVGKKVNLFVCVGWPFKGATIRTE